MRLQAVRRLASGFTLVEMLIVVLIMGMVVGLISVIVRPDAREMLRVEAERLAQLMDFATAEANLTGTTIMWTADAAGYRFWRLRDDTGWPQRRNGEQPGWPQIRDGEPPGWSEIRDSEVLRARKLPPGMAIAGVRVENMRFEGAPRLEFAPGALPLFFTIDLSNGAERYAVALSPRGHVQAIAEAAAYGVPAL